MRILRKQSLFSLDKDDKDIIAGTATLGGIAGGSAISKHYWDKLKNMQKDEIDPEFEKIAKKHGTTYHKGFPDLNLTGEARISNKGHFGGNALGIEFPSLHVGIGRTKEEAKKDAEAKAAKEAAEKAKEAEKAKAAAAEAEEYFKKAEKKFKRHRNKHYAGAALATASGLGGLVYLCNSDRV